ncbi:unnamed protein product [Clavelina lepadiformis]|uniref:G-protein coupled receptors family 2 profile 2 domain-containing protein n=1 Tax=Clavelina lepadiformis TaxID=159417 RepID=A0ABP0EZI7_CLALP
MDLTFFNSSAASVGFPVLYAGMSLSMLTVLVALVTFFSNKFLRIKRQNVITINLCLSMIFFYVGFLTSVTTVHVKGSFVNSTKDSIPTSCIAGAAMTCAGWLAVIFWVLVNWLYLSFTINKTVPRHVSHFVIKTTLPTYGIVLIILAAVAAVDEHLNHHLISYMCWYELRGAIAGLVIGATSLAFSGIVASAAFCSWKMSRKTLPTTPRIAKRNRRNFIQLMALTAIIVITDIPHLLLWILSAKDDAKLATPNEYIWIEIVDGCLSGAAGILVVVVLICRSNDFRMFWKVLLSGENPTKIRNFRLNNSTRKLPSRDISNVTNDTMDNQRSPKKYQPRDQVDVTIEDDVFYTSTDIPLPDSLVSTKAESNSGSTSADGFQIKRKIFRSSIKKSNKASSSSVHSTSYEVATARSSKTLNRIDFKLSRSSINGELDRKTSF